MLKEELNSTTAKMIERSASKMNLVKLLLIISKLKVIDFIPNYQE